MVAAAERHYYQREDARPADVLVYFRNDWKRKRDLKAMASELSEFIRANYPKDCDTVVLEKLNPEAKGWVDGASVIRISQGRQEWKGPGSASIHQLTYEMVAARVEGSSVRLAEYRRRAPGYQIWLLFSTRFDVLSSLWVPREAESWTFKSEFDRVILSSCEDGLIDFHSGGVTPE